MVATDPSIARESALEMQQTTTDGGVKVASSDNPPVQKGSSIQRVLDILEVIASSDRPLTPTELSEVLDIPKASIHRLCSSLESQGFLQAGLSGRGLLPGHRFNRMAQGVLASSPLRAERHAILTQLSQSIGETCNISIPDGSEMIYFDRAETHWPVRIQLQVGSRVPVYSTASGKMYLSSLLSGKRQRILQSTTLVPFTQNTIIDPVELEHELKQTNERGYAIDNEEYIQGMVALAIPVTDVKGRLYATVSFHAPVMRVTADSLETHLPLLLEAGDRLSELLDD